MRRFIAATTVALTLIPLTASAAASWHPFSSKSFGFSLRYPPGWKPTVINQGPNKQFSLIYAGKTNYSFTVVLLPLHPAASVEAAKSSFLTYEAKRMSNTTFAKLRWASSSVGGRPALVAIDTPPTEGGNKIATAIWLVNGKANILQIEAMAYHRLTKLSQFPAVYSQILKTWRFL